RSRLYASIVFFESPFSTVIIKRKESMKELSESFICGREGLLQGLANFFKPGRFTDLGAISIRHVKDIRYLVHVRRYLSHMNRQTELVQGMGNGKKNPDPIGGENFHDGEIIGGFIVNLNIGRDFRHTL